MNGDNYDSKDSDKGTNVVNFPLRGSEHATFKTQGLNGPVQELLKELDQVEADIESLLDSQFSPHTASLNVTNDIKLLEQQLNILEDVTQRFKFYLDEIDLHLN